MQKTLSFIVAGLAGWFLSLTTASAADEAKSLKDLARQVERHLNDQFDSLEALYKDIHTHPELSLMEERTAALLAKHMREAGYDVTEKVGGHGIVCVLKNGNGPTVMIRTDLDALPIEEQTGLPYASKVRMRDRFGREMPAMHACGHDMHMTSWLGTARVLAAMKDRWSGTLVFIGQPAEEIVAGARNMLADGLYDRFPKPDYALALHCTPLAAHGHVLCSAGLVAANSDTVDIVVKGKGGHGAAPHMTIDPVVLAARIVIDLQTIASREHNPTDPVVVTVGSIHGGTKHNIIPSEVRLQLTVRTTNDASRKHTIDAIGRIARAAAMGARAPEPDVKVSPDEFTPAMVNDAALARKTEAALREVLGTDKVHEMPLTMGSEDFSRYAQAGVPIFMYSLGTLAPERIADARREGGKPLPSLHSDQYYPIIEPSIRTGVLSMSTAVLNLVGK